MTFNPRLDRLTLSFYLFAVVASMLLGLGQQSTFLPGLITCGVIVSYIFTDRLQILVLPRLASYFAMLAGAVIAIGQVFSSGKLDHLPAVANLLIYVQLGLMFQQKDRRVFEQWGIFLLLEMIVAALVNDNLLYGVLLMPVLWIGCATLLCYASYVSQLKSGKTGSESHSIFSRLLKWLGRDRELQECNNSIDMQVMQLAGHTENLGGTKVGLRRAIGFAVNVVVFASAFFYIMPRLKSDSYEGAGWNQAVVGFSGEVSLENVGQLLETNAAALKLRFINVANGNNTKPLEPPYIRGAICHMYVGDGKWENLDKDGVSSDLLVDSPSTREISPKLENSAEAIELIVEEQTYFESATFSIPPFAKSNSRDTPTDLLAPDWTIFDRQRGRDSKTKRKYRFRTYAFESGVQSRLLPLFCNSLNDDKVTYINEQASIARMPMLTAFDAWKFPGVIALRDRILEKESSKAIATQVLALEDYLVTSADFTYSLAPSPKRNPQVDPIEDFASNHRTGHCQYFASTMTMMLRSMGIPSKIVLGFRPSDFNTTGMYFVVRQKHAHSWVEAFLTRAQLLEAGIKVPSYIREGAWLRLDPTPPGEGSNAGGSLRSRMGQFETLQQLWQDYVMGVDSSDQPEVLQFFDANNQSAYGQLRLNIEQLLLSLQTNQLVGGVFTPTQWFSLRGAFGFLILGSMLLAGYKLIVYAMRKMQLLHWQRGSVDSQRFVQIKFYRRVISALGKLQLRRAANQTPLEFANHVETFFASRREQFGDLSSEIQFLTSVYHRLRFGFDTAVQEAEWQQIESATQRLERLAASGASATRTGTT